MYNETINEYTDILKEASNSLGVIDPSTKRHSRTLSGKDAAHILGISHSTAVNKSTIMDNFANFGDSPLYNPYDILTIPVGAYGGLSHNTDDFSKSESGVTNPAAKSPKGTSLKRNKSSFTTTAGLWVFNKLFIEPLSDILGYINEPVTNDVLEDINNKLSYAILDDKITIRQLKNFIENTQVVMSCCSALASSHTKNIFTMQQLINKKKEELLSDPKIKAGIDSGDLATVKSFEKTLIDTAKDILKDDPCLDMFESGARSTYGNNFMTMYLMKSTIKDTSGNYHVITNSYIDGMDPKQYTQITDNGVLGSYARSCLTAKGGYLETLFKMSVAHLKLGPKGSDCGTKRYVVVDLDKKNKNDWMYSYMISSSGQLIELTPEVIDKYIGKKIHVRFSSLCEMEHGLICEHCAGTLFRRIGIDNIGLAGAIPMSSLKNYYMKQMHSNETKVNTLNPLKAFSLE